MLITTKYATLLRGTILFLVVALITYVSGGGLVTAVLVAMGLVMIHGLGLLCSAALNARLLRLGVYVAVFAAVPLLIYSLLASASQLTQRMGGVTLFFEGQLTIEGALVILLQFAGLGGMMYGLSWLLAKAIIEEGN